MINNLAICYTLYILDISIRQQGLKMPVQVNIKLNDLQQKERLQLLANKNTNGNISALIKLLADGKEILTAK